MQTKYQIFISYSHQDEWLKDELIAALSTVRREGYASVWHDRMLRPGADLDGSIDTAINESNLMVLVVSPDFIASEYCFNVEFKRALELRAQGKMEIVPVIVRECDFHIAPLSNLVALPNDGKPVNPAHANRDQRELRDAAWSKVAKAIRGIINQPEILSKVVQLKSGYTDYRVKRSRLNHGKVPEADVTDILVGPPIADTAAEGKASTIGELVKQIETGRSVLISGEDQSGKSEALYMLQKGLCAIGVPAVIVSGKEIRSRDIMSLVDRESSKQLEAGCKKHSDLVVLVDDLDECVLQEAAQRKIILDLKTKCRNVVATTYSQLHACLFVGSDMLDLSVINIEELSRPQIYELVEKWILLGEDEVDAARLEPQIRNSFKVVMGVLKGGSAAYTPGSILNLLRVLDASQGTDLAITSNAACYDALTSMHLAAAGVHSGQIDLYKNVLGFLAIEVWGKNESYLIGSELFKKTIEKIENTYLVELSKVANTLIVSKVLFEVAGGFEFASKTMLFFFAGRHLAKYAKEKDFDLYTLCVDECIAKINLRSHANTIIYCMYFNNDLGVLNKLIDSVDTIFGEASDWRLNEKFDHLTKYDEPMTELLQASEDHRANRMRVLGEQFKEVVQKEAKLVEHYLSPFSEVSVELEESADVPNDEITYVGRMNSLFRLQSVLSSALRTRSGTFERDTIVRTVESVVKASGRFSQLNLALAGQLMLQSKEAMTELAVDIADELRMIDAPPESARYRREADKLLFGYFDKFMDFLTKWSTIVSHGVVGRMLADASTIKALELLHKEEELQADGSPVDELNYNYAVVLEVAKLWKSGKIDVKSYERLIEKYGDHGRLFDIVRMSLYVFSRHMPIEVSDRQWLDDKMKIKIQGMRVRQRNVQRVIAGED